MSGGFPGGSDGKESSCNAGNLGLISELGRSPGEGNGNPLQYSCLENPMDRGACQATIHGVAKSQTGLGIHTHFPGGSAGKEFACNVGDLGSIPEFGRSPGEGKGYPLQYSGLESSVDCTEPDMTEWLSLILGILHWLQCSDTVSSY